MKCSNGPGLGQYLHLQTRVGLSLTQPTGTERDNGSPQRTMEVMGKYGGHTKPTPAPFLYVTLPGFISPLPSIPGSLVQPTLLSLPFYTHNSLVPRCLFSSVFVLQASIVASGPKYHLSVKFPFWLPLQS